MATVDTAPVAGQVFGPRPGIAIVSFLQGIVEIGLRAATIVLAVIIMICAAAAAGNVDDLSDDEQDFIDDSDDAGDPVPDTPDLVANTRTSAGWLIFLFFATVGYEGLWIVVRFLNIGLVNTYIFIFLIVDIVVSGLFALGYFSGAIAAAVNSSLWDEWVEFVEEYNNTFDEEPLEGARNSLGAASFFSFVILAVFGGIAVWMILFLIMKWNEKVVKYTVKDAVTT